MFGLLITFPSHFRSCPQTWSCIDYKLKITAPIQTKQKLVMSFTIGGCIFWLWAITLPASCSPQCGCNSCFLVKKKRKSTDYHQIYTCQGKLKIHWFKCFLSLIVIVTTLHYMEFAEYSSSFTTNLQLVQQSQHLSVHHVLWYCLCQ